MNSSRSVNAADIAGVKARAGSPADGSNFRFDLNTSGSISPADVSTVKSRSGMVIPVP